jgi:hypothetical protein
MIKVNLRIYFFENYDNSKPLKIQKKSTRITKIDCFKFDLSREDNNFIDQIVINESKFFIKDDLYTKRRKDNANIIDDHLLKKDIELIYIELFNCAIGPNYILNDLKLKKDD